MGRAGCPQPAIKPIDIRTSVRERTAEGSCPIPHGGFASASLYLEELEAYGRANFKVRARRRERASRLVDLEEEDTVRALIADNEPAAGRIDAEAARGLALR